MRLYIVANLYYKKETVGLNDKYSLYMPCYKNMQELLEKNEIRKIEQEMTAKDQIYLVSPLSDIQDGKYRGSKYITDFKIIKKLSAKELINEYMKATDLIIYTKLLDIIFECEDLKDEDIEQLYKWMFEHNEIQAITGRPRIKSEMLYKIFLHINYGSKSINLNVVTSIINNPSLNHLDMMRILGEIQPPSFISFIINSSETTVKTFEKLIDCIYDYESWIEIIKSPKVTLELLEKIISKIEAFVWRFQDRNIKNKVSFNLLKEIINNPISNKYIYKSILLANIYMPELFRTALLTEIAAKEDIDLEIITIILNSTGDENVIDSLVDRNKFEESQINTIIQKSHTNKNIISKLIKYNKLSISQLEYIMDQTNETDIISLLIYSPLIETIIDGLKQKLFIKPDINIFKKLYLLEDLKLSNQLESWSEDSEIPQVDYRKEKLTFLNKYLLCFNALDIRAFILNEMCDLEYLKKEHLIDEEYYGKCPRSLKICSLVKHHKDEEIKEG